MHEKDDDDDDEVEDSFSNVTDMTNDESEIHEEKCAAARCLKGGTVGTDAELQLDLRYRKFQQSSNTNIHATAKSKINRTNKDHELESRSDKSLSELTESSSEIAAVDEQQVKTDYKAYYICWNVITLLSFLTRLYSIELPAHIW